MDELGNITLSEISQTQKDKILFDSSKFIDRK